MGQAIDYDWSTHKQGRGCKYPWTEWLNGESWELTRGVDFTLDDASFRAAVSAAARSKGLRARVAKVAEGKYVIAAAPAQETE